MPTPDEIAEAIGESAENGIKRVRVGNQETEMLTPEERQQAAAFAASNDAAAKSHRGLRFTQLIPPGGG